MLSTRLGRSPFARVCKVCSRRLYSTPTTPAPAPLLLKFREDLKTAMRAKDTNRLNVLRALLAEITNAAKTSTPYNTDVQIVNLLRKKMTSARDTAKTFQEQQREDLAAKEDAQAEVMQEYANMVKIPDEASIQKTIEDTLARLKTENPDVTSGRIFQVLFGQDGPFSGVPVDRNAISKKVTQMLKSDDKSKQ